MSGCVADMSGLTDPPEKMASSLGTLGCWLVGEGKFDEGSKGAAVSGSIVPAVSLDICFKSSSSRPSGEGDMPPETPSGTFFTRPKSLVWLVSADFAGAGGAVLKKDDVGTCVLPVLPDSAEAKKTVRELTLSDGIIRSSSVESSGC